MKIAILPLLRKRATLRLRQIERDITQINTAIEATLSADETLFEKACALIAIPGIAKFTVYAMLIELPELDGLSGKQAANLVGFAPILGDASTTCQPRSK